MSDSRFYLIFLWIILSLIGLSTCRTSITENQRRISIIAYQKAYAIIKDSILLKLNINNNRLLVKEELISFGNYAQFFQAELTNKQQFSINELLFDSLLVARVADLSHIGANRKKNNSILFFSEQKKSYFFAEIFLKTNRTQFTFSERPLFGTTIVFLFKTENDDVKYIKSREIIYN